VHADVSVEAVIGYWHRSSVALKQFYAACRLGGSPAPGTQTLGLSNGLKEIISPHRRSHYACRQRGAPIGPRRVRRGERTASILRTDHLPRPAHLPGAYYDQARSRNSSAPWCQSLHPQAGSTTATPGDPTTLAILAHGDVDGQAPVAWARLLLPTPGAPSFGWDPRCTGFILPHRTARRLARLAPRYSEPEVVGPDPGDCAGRSSRGGRLPAGRTRSRTRSGARADHRRLAIDARRPHRAGNHREREDVRGTQTARWF